MLGALSTPAPGPRRFVGVGAMRVAELMEEDAIAVLAAALDAGVTLVDTAASYGRSSEDRHGNERVVRAAIGPREGVTVVTKCGMDRAGPSWIPNGKKRAIVADAEGSAAALGVAALDVLLLHAPDPRTPIETSARALEELRRAGVARAIGLCNVGHRDLERARSVAEIAFVQLPLGAHEHRAFRDGLARRCLEAGITVLMHSPLGGTERAAKLSKDRALRAVAERHRVTPQTIALAFHCRVHPMLVPIPGVRTLASARAAAHAAAIVLAEGEEAALGARFPAARDALRRRAPPSHPDKEIVLVMGMQGSGKSTIARAYEARGYLRLNRDERGGSMQKIHAALDEALAGGHTKVVLDNTYPTRASRAAVVEIAARHAAAVHCLFLDTPRPTAERNVVRRLLERNGELPPPSVLERRSSTDPQLFGPSVLFRYERALERPEEDEGFATLEIRPFDDLDAGFGEAEVVLVAEACLEMLPPLGEVPLLVVGWCGDRPVGEARSAIEARLRARGLVGDVALCDHPGGPPVCWCRPPRPGLALSWMRARGASRARTKLYGQSPTDRELAASLGIELVALTPSTLQVPANRGE